MGFNRYKPLRAIKISNMNTAEKNTIIAEFMGLELEQTIKGTYVYAVTQSYYDSTERTFTGFYEPKDLKFHSSWDWLMPVVEKIESLDYCVTIKLEHCRINPQGKPDILVKCGKGYTKKEVTYNACIEFIKWFNKQK